ncbi:MAG: FAD-binding oxidoreductase [Acidimicrobiales bacterium]
MAPVSATSTSAGGALLDRLAGIVGAAHVLTEPDVTAGYTRDWTGRFRGATPAVVRPADTEQTAAVVAACAAAGAPLVPQGGNTGLVGGGVPLAGELVLSLRRLTRLDPVDRLASQVTAGAGVTIAALQAHASAAGLAYGVDLGARDSATLGGTIATNAGGLQLLRYGGTREQLVGCEAVLADGSIVRHLDGLLKDNTGYDLGKLLCGSEGTLGVVTAARVRLHPAYAERVAALLAFASVEAAVAAVMGVKHRLESLEAAELFFGDGLALVCDALGLPAPFPQRHPAYVLLQCAAHHDPTDELAAALGELDGLVDAAVAADTARRRELWRYREGHTEAINSLGAPHKLDVTIPAARIAEFVAAAPAVVAAAAPAARTWLFGHAADGNVHVNVTGVAPEDDTVDDVVLRCAASFGGSISAEHGIGTAKKPWLHLNRSPAELAAFGAIKRALDPAGVLNPNVLLPAAGTGSEAP